MYIYQTDMAMGVARLGTASSINWVFGKADRRGLNPRCYMGRQTARCRAFGASPQRSKYLPVHWDVAWLLLVTDVLPRRSSGAYRQSSCRPASTERISAVWIKSEQIPKQIFFWLWICKKFSGNLPFSSQIGFWLLVVSLLGNVQMLSVSNMSWVFIDVEPGLQNHLTRNCRNTLLVIFHQYILSINISYQYIHVNMILMQYWQYS